MISLTIADKNLGYNFDIPTIEFATPKETVEFITDWIDSKNMNDSVFVLFESNKETIHPEDFRSEHRSFLVSHVLNDILTFAGHVLVYSESENPDFAIFECENYQEAFEYLIDLKDGTE